MKVRIKFQKNGPIRFIGHLDVMRFFQKAIRRAEIDVAYTTGFSPHQIMSFAAPLGVGLESNGEYMDIECHSVTSGNDMMERLNRASVPGIKVISVKQLPEDAGNAMASVSAARYTVRFRDNSFIQDNLDDKIAAFLAKDCIKITKETKTGVKEVDIRPGIYEMKTVFDGTVPGIEMLVDASSAGNIKPAKVIASFWADLGVELTESSLFITREDVYTNIGTEERMNLVPLDDIGFDIK